MAPIPPGYTPLPTTLLDAEKPQTPRTTTTTATPARTGTRTLFGVVVGSLFLLAAGISVSHSLSRGLSSLLPSLNSLKLAPCHGNTHVSSKSGLPTHYTLPSGDAIPSVALGTASAV